MRGWQAAPRGRVYLGAFGSPEGGDPEGGVPEGGGPDGVVPEGGGPDGFDPEGGEPPPLGG
jgi:hypothetical protein